MKERFMHVKGAKEKVCHIMSHYEGVSIRPHRFGGSEFNLGKREIGHIHGDYLVDIPFPMRIRNEIIDKGLAEPHHVLPESGWVSIFLRGEEDVENAINLLKKSYELAVEQGKKRNSAVHSIH